MVWAFLDFGQVQLDNFGRKNSSVKGQSYVPSGGRFTHMSTLDEKDEVWTKKDEKDETDENGRKSCKMPLARHAGQYCPVVADSRDGLYRSRV